MRRAAVLAMVQCMLFLASNAAMARETIINEIKFGALAHDIATSRQREHGVDVNGEVLFQPLDLFSPTDDSHWLTELLNPRPVIGVSVNTSGYTDQLYFGANWHADLWDAVVSSSDSTYAEFSFGGAVHDGRLGDSDTRYEALGSRVLFHISTELGIAFDNGYAAGFYFEHDSNGGMAHFNRSLNNAGLRIGYRF